MAKKNLQKLELTWIGKGDEPKLEPRILIEQPEYSYGDPDSDNMIIHGDNLLALKALEQEYTGEVKCIYIDPPFNTGAAFDHYDDGIEHSVWLDLMSRRLKILHKLLASEGSIFIHLDDNELDYCKILCDEIFGRENFINRITLSARSPSAFSTVNPGVFKSSEYILWFAKNKSRWESRSMRIKSKRDIAYNKFIINREDDFKTWKIKPLKIAFLEMLNQNKIEDLTQTIDSVFGNDFFVKKDLLLFLVKNFKFDQMVDLKKVATYLFKKIKEDNIEKAKKQAYVYLLEKTSFNFSSKDIDSFVFKNSKSVFRETEISDSGAGQETVDLKRLSLERSNNILIQRREEPYDDIYILNGKQISFYSKNVVNINEELTASSLLTNIWNDISWEGIAKEGAVKFKKGKKPEKLLERCFSLTTNIGDLILDSFLGSGTTAAVAHKMERKYIGIELGNHAYSHCQKRLKNVIDGDQSGISKMINWQGGGGFKFYTLAPSLLQKDKYNNWVIEEKYNADMLAAAMAKQEGFRYQPDDTVYWKQGQSSEQDFIYTTTQFLTRAQLSDIADGLNDEESLLICCTQFEAGLDNAYPNINLRKIPSMLLNRCEFGVEDYSLNIINSPLDDLRPEQTPTAPEAEQSTTPIPDLFNQPKN